MGVAGHIHNRIRWVSSDCLSFCVSPVGWLVPELVDHWLPTGLILGVRMWHGYEHQFGMGVFSLVTDACTYPGFFHQYREHISKMEHTDCAKAEAVIHIIKACSPCLFLVMTLSFTCKEQVSADYNNQTWLGQMKFCWKNMKPSKHKVQHILHAYSCVSHNWMKSSKRRALSKASHSQLNIKYWTAKKERMDAGGFMINFNPVELIKLQVV